MRLWWQAPGKQTWKTVALSWRLSQLQTTYYVFSAQCGEFWLWHSGTQFVLGLGWMALAIQHLELAWLEIAGELHSIATLVCSKLHGTAGTVKHHKHQPHQMST